MCAHAGQVCERARKSGVTYIAEPGGSIRDDHVIATADKYGKLLTNGGRVLGVTATAQDLRSAVEKAYTMVQSVQFDNAFYRHDIGQRALKALEQ